MPARQYSSQAVQTSLVGNVSAGTTTIPVASVIGFPSTYPYTLVLDKGTSNEEIIEITNASGTSLTATRAIDGSTALAHSNGALVVHAVTARDLREPQDHIYATSNVHGVTGALLGGTSPTINTPTVNGGTFNSPIIQQPIVGDYSLALHDHNSNLKAGFLNPTRCSLKRGATAPITSNVDTLVIADTSDYQVGGTWWTTGSTITIPANGDYLFTIRATYQNASAGGGMRIARMTRISDGINVVEVTSPGPGNTVDWTVCAGSDVARCTAGQTFNGVVRQTSGVSVTLASFFMTITCIARN